MPDDRLARTRRSLPPGYQFGDARATCPPHQWTSLGGTLTWVHGLTWIEDRQRCHCGLETSRRSVSRSPMGPAVGWNVIEGDHE